MPVSDYAPITVTLRSATNLDEIAEHLKVVTTDDGTDKVLIAEKGTTNVEFKVSSESTASTLTATISESYSNVVTLTDATFQHGGPIKEIYWE